MKTFKDALNCMKWHEIRLTILFTIFWPEHSFAHQWKNCTFKKWWNETGKWLYIATLGPIWKISSSAENLARLSLQDGATKWLYFLPEPPTQQDRLFSHIFTLILAFHTRRDYRRDVKCCMYIQICLTRWKIIKINARVTPP